MKRTLLTLVLAMLTMAAGSRNAAAQNIRENPIVSPVIGMTSDNREVCTHAAPSSGEFVYKSVVMIQAGTLESLLGSRINDIDSLIVTGPINADDLRVMWSGSLHGRLSAINLENAIPENDELPDNAFWHANEQDQPDKIYVPKLKRIILPERIKRIGKAAFAWCVNLEECNMPTSLQELGDYAFSDCRKFKTSPLIIPEGVVDIPVMCFKECYGLGEVILPSSIRNIKEGGFYRAKISKINLPEGLESIERDGTFYATNLEEVHIPSTCLTITGSQTFADSHKLKKIHIPDGIRIVPSGFVSRDTELEEINIPASVEIIESEAMSSCWSLTNISLPEGLREIRSKAFQSCKSLKVLDLPSTLTYLGWGSCLGLSKLEAIYCKAEIPPVCAGDQGNESMHTFCPVSKNVNVFDTPKDIPVYIPKGTKELYRMADGWDYFTNFIETDFSGIEDITSDREEDGIYYDLMGRRIMRPRPNQPYIKNNRKYIYINQ